jgi:hypothetical protein
VDPLLGHGAKYEHSHEKFTVPHTMNKLAGTKAFGGADLCKRIINSFPGCFHGTNEKSQRNKPRSKSSFCIHKLIILDTVRMYAFLAANF